MLSSLLLGNAARDRLVDGQHEGQLVHRDRGDPLPVFATQGRGFDRPAPAPSVKVIRGEWVNREPLIPDRQRCLVGLVRRMGRGQGYTISEPAGSGTSAALLPCGRERCGQGFRRARPSLAPTRAWAGGLRSLGAAAAEEDEPCASPRDRFAAEIRGRPGTARRARSGAYSG